MVGFMKYAVEMGSGSITYIPSLLKTGSGILKLIEGVHRHTVWISHEPILGKYTKNNIIKP
jgi:hypothetical protein